MMQSYTDNSINAAFSVMKQIHGAEVKDLVTKFFYRGNQLCFQIILQVDGGERIPYKEFSDYAEYKKAFSELQQQKGSPTMIRFPEKNLTVAASPSNVA